MKKINFGSYEPKRCWVGESQKICYASRDEAEVAAQVVAHDYGALDLTVYVCEYGNQWHLSSGGQISRKKR